MTLYKRRKWYIPLLTFQFTIVGRIKSVEGLRGDRGQTLGIELLALLAGEFQMLGSSTIFSKHNILNRNSG